MRERLQKIMAGAGVASRRAAEEMIRLGRVSINGQVVSLPGTSADPEKDEIRVDGRLIAVETAKIYLMLNKPRGYVTTLDDPRRRPIVTDLLADVVERVFPVGRLDYDSEGLLLFTNDGELANKLMHPRYELEREYAVRTLGELTEEQAKSLTEGIQLEDGLAKFNLLRDEGGEGVNHWYRVTISEGRNREVRRMFEAIGLTVSRLMRVRYGTVELPARLKRGMWMEMPEAEACQLAGLPAPVREVPKDERAKRPPKMHRTTPTTR